MPSIKAIAKKDNIDRYLSRPPAFGDEKEILPLQGADLFAWEQRNHAIRNRAIYVRPTHRWAQLNTIRTFSMAFKEVHLDQMHNPLFTISAEFFAANPEAPMLFASKANRKKSKQNNRGATAKL